MGLGISLLVTLPALDGISLFGTELSVLGPTAAGTAGLVGASIIDRILDSGEDGSDGGDDGGGDALMDDDGFGGMDGGMDGGGMDGGGGDDFGGMDDGMDDWGGDGDFGDGGGGGGGGDVDELEHQVDELENEVASLSSTVNTVKSENTEISDRIEDVEEDVRNLLDIYEMVTRGINPFVDENDSGEFDLGGDDSLGLFDSNDGGDGGSSGSQQQDDDVDDSVMSADADGFFDDELAEDEPDDEFEDELAEDDADEFGEETESEQMVSDQDSTGGKSFSELKDEYDSGDASWAEEDAEDGDDEFGEMDGMDESLDESDDGFGEIGESFDDGEDEFGEMDDSFDDAEDEFGGMDDEPEDSLSNGSEGSMETPKADHSEPEPDDQSLSPIEEDSDDADFEYVTSDQLSSESKKPYLTTLPGDYVGDLVVMEWLEFLVEESSVTDTARAVNYYERIEWIDEPVADHLRSFLSGFGDIDRNKVDRPGTDQLSRTHHVHSLKYIMKLNNGTTATSVILDRWDTFTQGGDGI